MSPIDPAENPPPEVGGDGGVGQGGGMVTLIARAVGVAAVAVGGAFAQGAFSVRGTAAVAVGGGTVTEVLG